MRSLRRDLTLSTLLVLLPLAPSFTALADEADALFDDSVVREIRITFGRETDGDGAWVALSTPTPGRSNSPSPRAPSGRLGGPTSAAGR